MSRVTIIAIFAVFFAPVVIAVLMHSQWFEWRPDQTRNHGDLIEPAHPLADFELIDADGSPLRRHDLLGQWQLIHVVPGSCGEACVEALYWMRQVRRAQDRHQGEVGLLLAAGTTLDEQTRQAIAELQAGIRILEADAGRAFMALLPERPQAPVSYMADPRAHIILGYARDAGFNGMRRDLRRLLTWTRSEQSGPNSATSDR